MRLVVTGASSFVGHHLALALAAHHSVVATHRYPVASYVGRRAERLSRLDVPLYRLDIADRDAVVRAVDELRPDAWIHHAGYAHGAEPTFDNVKAARTNVAPLYGLIPALAAAGCQGLLLTGSIAEYTPGSQPHDEREECAPASEYGRSRLEATLAAREIAGQAGLAVRVARLGHPFGALDEDRRLVPSVVAALRAGRAVDLSDGLQVLGFHHVDLIPRACLALVGDLARGGFEIVNVASGPGHSARELVETFCDGLGAPSELLRFGALPRRGDEPSTLVGSDARLAALGVIESRTLEEQVAAALAEMAVV